MRFNKHHYSEWIALNYWKNFSWVILYSLTDNINSMKTAAV